MQSHNSKKIKSLFLKFSPGNLLILLYQLSKFEAIAVIVFEKSSFLCPNFQRAITQKKKKFSPGSLLIILYLLTKFKACSFILFTKFHYYP